MSEQIQYKQLNTKTPELQDLTMSLTIGGIAYELSQRLDISPSRALDLFYRSKTCKQLHDKRTGLYLMSNGYVADDFILDLLTSPIDDIVYTVDVDNKGNYCNFQAHAIEDLPEDYLPEPNSYYEFEPEDINQENLSLAELSGKKLDWFRKVCAVAL